MNVCFSFSYLFTLTSIEIKMYNRLYSRTILKKTINKNQLSHFIFSYYSLLIYHNSFLFHYKIFFSFSSSLIIDFTSNIVFRCWTLPSFVFARINGLCWYIIFPSSCDTTITFLSFWWSSKFVMIFCHLYCGKDCVDKLSWGTRA